MTTQCCSCEKVTFLEKYSEKKVLLEKYIASLDLDIDMEKRRGHLIQCLHEAQAIFGFLHEELQLFVANKQKSLSALLKRILIFSYYNCF